MKIVTDLKLLKTISCDVDPNNIPDLNNSLALKLKESVGDGLGLAAIQLGIALRVFIMKLKNESLITIYNPTIVEKYEPITFKREGCLSLPKVFVNTQRYNRIQAQWLNEKGKIQKGVLLGLEAVEFQHECDHLDGILITDREVKLVPFTRTPKVGRNSTCPCGSGNKYKKCCLIKERS